MLRTHRPAQGLFLATCFVCGWIFLPPTMQVAHGQPPAEPALADDLPEADSPEATIPSAVTGTFPVEGLLPKVETGAIRFLKEHPEFDGRGVVVAIFDTGVDPGAAGLQITSDGRPKVIDLVDATGSGDVDTTATAKLGDGPLTGLSGRRLKLPQRLLSTSGERTVHLGLKAAYDFFPSGLISRMKRERREDFASRQHELETRLQREIAAWEQEHPEPDAEARRHLAELRERLAQCRHAWKEFDDPGPVFDCLVYQEGEQWWAIVDTDADGDLAEEKRLTNFRSSRQYATFGLGAELNFAVNIYQQGKRLSIVCDSSSHGTHVAGIVSAHFPEQPELNGLAPGAQIVSVKIGDSRLGSMETGRALARGLIAAADNQVDLINMSYGEPTALPNGGRLPELFTRLVEDRDVLFVASAGNSGPALSTVGAPGGSTEALFGVGAYVSPAMMAAEYALREQLPENAYTWTSRGPTLDGAAGVDLFAPGGAVAPVPTWTLTPNQQMNGTSMASPNACGAMALLVSGLKASSVGYSPTSIRRALQNTARPVAGIDLQAQGPGLIQIDRAWEYLTTYEQAPGEQVALRATFPGRGGARGLYLREPADTAAVVETTLQLGPVFPDDASTAEKIGYQLRLRLEADQPWVSLGEHLLLTAGGGRTTVRVDPTLLEPGLHTAEVQVLDDNRPDRGPLARVPITVIKPHAAEGVVEARLPIEPGQINRQFIAVPAGATWANLTLTAAEADSPRRVVAHMVQLIDGQSFEFRETNRRLSLEPNAPTRISFPVEPGGTLEVCLAQFWSSLGETVLESRLEFGGLVSDEYQLTLAPEQTTPVTVAAAAGPQRLRPNAQLQTHRRVVAPTTAKLELLTAERDRLPWGEQLSRLLLTYEISQSKRGRVSITIPTLKDLLYEGPVASVFWVLDGPRGQLVAAGDPYEKSFTLDRGDYTLRLELCDSDQPLLEKFKTLPLAVDRPLERNINVSVAASPVDAAVGRSLGSQRVPAGEAVTVYLAPPPADALPKEAEPGDLLLGSITWSEDDPATAAEERRPGGFPLRMPVPAARPESKSAAATAATPPKTAEQLADAVFAFRIRQLETLAESKHDELFEALAAELTAERPESLEVGRVRVARLDDDSQGRKAHLPKIIGLCDEMITRIDPEALRQQLAEAGDKPGAELTRRREMLIDMLYRKARALAYMELPDVVAEHPIADEAAHDEKFAAAFDSLAKWVDTTDEDYFLLHIRRDRRRGDRGQSLKLLNKYIPTAEPTYFYFKKRRDLYEELGWEDWHQYEADWLLRRFPPNREPL